LVVQIQMAAPSTTASHLNAHTQSSMHIHNAYHIIIMVLDFQGG